MLYPNCAKGLPSVWQLESTAWIEAQRLEYQDKTPMAAGAGYARIAARSENVHIQARALQAQMRCLAKAGQVDSAVKIATGVLAEDKYHNATDAQGRLIGLNVQLFALKLIDDPKSPGYQKTLKLLEKRVTDYRDSALSANQRHFLMRQLDGLLGESDNSLMLSMLWAEDLAAEYLSSDSRIVKDGRIGPTKLKDIWQLVTPDRTAVALFTPEYFAFVLERTAKLLLSPGVSVKLVPPGVEVAKEPFLSAPAGQGFPNWHLAL